MRPRAPRPPRAGRAARGRGRRRSDRRARACAAAPRCPGSPSSRSARAALARTHQARSERQASSGPSASTARQRAERLRGLGAHRPVLRSSAAISAGTQAASPTRPSARAAEIRTSVESTLQQCGECGRGAGIAGEAQRSREAGVELDLIAAGRDARENVGDRRGPLLQRGRIVSTAHGAPSRSMIRSGGSSAGHRAQISNSAARGVAARASPEQATRRTSGSGSASRGTIRSTTAGNAGPGEQQRSPGARGRTAGFELCAQVGE